MSAVKHLHPEYVSKTSQKIIITIILTILATVCSLIVLNFNQSAKASDKASQIEVSVEKHLTDFEYTKESIVDIKDGINTQDQKLDKLNELSIKLGMMLEQQGKKLNELSDKHLSDIHTSRNE